MSEPIKARVDLTGKQKKTDMGTYTFTRFIAQGNYGDIWLAKRAEKGKTREYVIKNILKLEDPNDSGAEMWNGISRNEIETNKEVRNSNDRGKEHILHFEEEFMYKHPELNQLFYCLVFKYAKGKDLFDLTTDFKYSEEDVAKMMHCILKGVQFLHDSLDIIHFDLKPENLMLYREGSLNPVIGDLASAIHPRSYNKPEIHYDDVKKDKPHSMKYLPPELRKPGPNQIVTKSTDMFSLGIICVELLLRFNPFSDAEDEEKEEQLIADCNLDFSRLPGWNKITPEGQGFVKKLTCRYPELRGSAKEALTHEWFTLIDSSNAPKSFRQPLDGSRRSRRRAMRQLWWKTNPQTGKCGLNGLFSSALTSRSRTQKRNTADKGNPENPAPSTASLRAARTDKTEEKQGTSRKGRKEGASGSAAPANLKKSHTGHSRR